MEKVALPHAQALTCQKVVRVTAAGWEEPGWRQFSGQAAAMGPERPRQPWKSLAATRRSPALVQPAGKTGPIVALGGRKEHREVAAATPASGHLPSQQELETVGDGCSLPPIRSFTGGRGNIWGGLAGDRTKGRKEGRAWGMNKREFPGTGQEGISWTGPWPIYFFVLFYFFTLPNPWGPDCEREGWGCGISPSPHYIWDPEGSPWQGEHSGRKEKGTPRVKTC